MDIVEIAGRRKVHRSPNYPFLSLPEAIGRIAVIYKAEARTATTQDVIAQHLGYKPETGPGRRTIAALKQFGLLDDLDGRLRISDSGFILAQYSRDSDEWKRAAGEAAVRPPLFRELLEKFPGGQCSDATLRNDLLGRGFNPASIGLAIKSFRDTQALAPEMRVMSPLAEPEPEQGIQQLDTRAHLPGSVEPMVGQELAVPLEFASDGRPAVVARVNFNAPIKREYLSRLRAFLAAWEQTIGAPEP